MKFIIAVYPMALWCFSNIPGQMTAGMVAGDITPSEGTYSCGHCHCVVWLPFVPDCGNCHTASAKRSHVIRILLNEVKCCRDVYVTRQTHLVIPQ